MTPTKSKKNSIPAQCNGSFSELKPLVRSSRSGFTLVETMIALCIFAVAMLAAFMVMVSAGRTLRANQEQAYVAHVLETTIETIRNLSWEELKAQPSTQSFDATKPLVPLFGKAINPSASTDVAFEGNYFTPAGTIVIEDVAGAAEIKKVTVKVVHNSSASGSKVSSTLSTLISKNGIDRQ